MVPFPVAARQTGRAELPHPAFTRPIAIPRTNALACGEFATIRERLIKIGARVIEHIADSGDCGRGFRLIADSDSDRSRTAFR
jgi:hypothetical protein